MNALASLKSQLAVNETLHGPQMRMNIKASAYNALAAKRQSVILPVLSMLQRMPFTERTGAVSACSIMQNYQVRTGMPKRWIRYAGF
jgi:hypothetical protein